MQSRGLLNNIFLQHRPPNSSYSFLSIASFPLTRTIIKKNTNQLSGNDVPPLLHAILVEE